MSRIKLLLVAAVAVLALLASASTASAFVVSPCTVTGTSVNCSGDLTGLPPGVSRVVLTVDYVCVYKFHLETVASRGSSTAAANVTSDAHGNAKYNLTVTAPACHGDTIPVPKSATITASQGAFSLVIGPIPL